MIVWEAKDDSSLLYTRSWKPKGPNKYEWMENLHGILHGNKWIIFHHILDCIRPIKEVGLTQTWGPWQSIELPLAPRIIILPWLRPKPKNMLQSLSMVHFHFKLSMRAHQLHHNTTFGWFLEALRFSWPWLLVHVQRNPDIETTECDQLASIKSMKFLSNWAWMSWAMLLGK